MKIQVEDKEKVFSPFKFTVEIETKEEAIKFFVLLDHTKIIKTLDLPQGFISLRDILQKQADIQHGDYLSLFNKFDDLIK